MTTRRPEPAVLALCIAVCLAIPLAPGRPSLAAATRAAPAAHPPESDQTRVADLSADRIAAIDRAIEQQIASRLVPGAVVVVGRGDAPPYRRAYGLRATAPGPVPMTMDTLFDLASLTKVVATTPAVLHLADRGRLDLDAPAARYWPQFAARGKGTITIRELLTHYSGLPADLDLEQQWSGTRTALRLLVNEVPLARPGQRYVYSDENFVALGEIVRRVSGLTLDAYCERFIFRPLAMSRTRFRPRNASDVPIAPTTPTSATGEVIEVNDPTAARMNGIAGHAGLFSTANDLARFARMLLRGGELDGAQVLRAASVQASTQAASPQDGARLRGLGWDLAQPGGPLPQGSFGHTGYTGTLIWIDPASRTYVIILTNRTYPDGRGNAQPLRDAVLNAVFARPGEGVAAD